MLRMKPGVSAPIGGSQPSEAASATRYFLLGTAGHIDHGKSSLVRALTGTDPDRLPEEKRRGMTIELGFAELTVGNARFGIVDVPGHERFVRTMVAGATGIDIAMLVVAADDSVMPQTVEHVDILRLLGVRHGLVALTKIDVVDPDMVELVGDEIRQLLASTALANAPICPVSSVTGRGLDELKTAILTVSRSVAAPPAEGPFRMAVDRVFTVAGRGTVVTGSALRGSVSVGDTLEVWPAGETGRVRDLQTHGLHSDRLQRGQRCAMNLIGVERERLERGAELATPGFLQPSRLIDVRLECLPSYAKPLKSTSVVRLEIGTADLPIRVVLWNGGTLAPGQSAYAQLRSGAAITSVHGQRFIVRDENAVRTIGGGIVLRPVAHRRRRVSANDTDTLRRLESQDPADRVEQVLHDSGFVTPSDLALCARAGVEPSDLPALLIQAEREKRWVPVVGTTVRAVPAAIDDLSARLTHWLERHHQKNPQLPGRPIDAVVGWLERMTSKALARPLFDGLLKRGAFKRLGAFACLPAFAPSLSAAEEKMLGTLVAEIKAGGFQPPTLDELSIHSPADRKRIERLATLAVALGELIPVEGKLYLHAATEKRLRDTVASLIGRGPGVTVAQVREALNSSRKFVVPFLEYLDRVGFTRRVGDQRLLADKTVAPNS